MTVHVRSFTRLTKILVAKLPVGDSSV